MKMRIRLSTALLMLFLADAGYAFQCAITTTPVNFGFYDPLAMADLNSSGGITVTCNAPVRNPVVPVTLSLSAGNSGSFTQRLMTSTAGGALNYNLYSDAAKTSVIGDGSGGSMILTNVISKATTWNVTIYGRVPAGQNVVPGVYSDSITATIVW